MGVINIPPDPSGPGHVSVHIDIGKAELQSINALLRQVQDYLQLKVKEDGSQSDLDRTSHAASAGSLSASGKNTSPQPSLLEAEQARRVPNNMQALFPSEGSNGSGSRQSNLMSDAHIPEQQQRQGSVVSDSYRTEQQQQHLSRAGSTSSSFEQQQQQQQIQQHQQQIRASPQIRQDAPVEPGPAARQPPGLRRPDTYPSLEEAQNQRYAADPPGQYPQQQQAYQQDNRIASYGSGNAGNDRWIGTFGRRTGKQVMATQGTKAPLTINYMSWEGGESEASSKDEDEAPVQAIPGAGRPRQSKLGYWNRTQSGQSTQSTQSSQSSRPPPEPPAARQPATAVPKPATAPVKAVNACAQPAAALPPPAAASAWQAAAAPFSMPAQQPAVMQTAAHTRAMAQIDTSVQWQRMWITEAADHNNQPVRTCLHLAKMTDLHSEEGNAGYLISASSNLLTLWQCSCSYDEPALQLIHQLDSEFYASDLQLDVANNVLLAAARDTKTSAECVAVHHLRLTQGIFRLQGRLALPVGAAAPRAKGPASPKATQVQCVNHYQGTLAGCCAASHGSQIAIYPTKIVPGELAKAKGAWNAHDSPITALHAGTFQPDLLSGDHSGLVRGWNMKSKPSQPIYQFQHKAAVTGLFANSDRTFLSTSTDSRLALWDIRNPGRPLNHLVAPDSRPILKMSVQLESNQLAFATTAGVYAMDLDRFGRVQTVTTMEQGQPLVLGLAWNSSSKGQSYLYAANGPTISAYKA